MDARNSAAAAPAQRGRGLGQSPLVVAVRLRAAIRVAEEERCRDGGTGQVLRFGVETALD